MPRSVAAISPRGKPARNARPGNAVTKHAAAAGADVSVARRAVSTTLRLEPDTRRGLELLQAELGSTLNKLLNEGLAIFVAQRTAALERNVQANLERIRQYRKTDPAFSKTFAVIAEEEAAHGHDDPLAGLAYIEQASPALRAVRQLIHSRR